jgi:2-methylcitrate dehydratase PrpD
VEDSSIGQTEAKATVRLRGGETRSEHVHHATGTPENPISDEELREKFTELVEPELGADSTRQVVGRVERLGRDGSLKTLLDVLSPAADTVR